MKSPGAAATARDVAHEEVLMDELSATCTASPSGQPPGGDSSSAEVHHAVLRCLLRLYDRAESSGLDGEGIQAWIEWEMEAMRWRVPVEIARSELEALVASSEVVLEREKHRLLHQNDYDRMRIGCLAGLSCSFSSLRSVRATFFVAQPVRVFESLRDKSYLLPYRSRWTI